MKRTLCQKLLTATLLTATLGCTGQIPGSFRLAQQEQRFSSELKINTKIDLLWVVDNSSSMDVSQEKLRQGFAGFARKYMQPTWDIRVAVITTDTYLADSSYQNFLDSKVSGTTGWKSPYIYSRLNTWANPSSSPNLVNPVTGIFDDGVTYKDMIPVWGQNWSLLLPGLHDGPTPAMCFEGMPYFLLGVTQCPNRDQSTNLGISHCLNPDTAAGETSLTECVNTTQNNTVRTGKAIINTLPETPLNAAQLAARTEELIQDFTINVTTGSNGMGSERGLGSLLQLVKDNEVSSTAFFRPGSLRGIIFVSDEDDQTMLPEESPGAGFSPWTHYQCDQSGLISMNPSANITNNKGYCCNDPAKNCRFGAQGTSCPLKTVGDLSYRLSICANPEKLAPVSSIKSQLDDFFVNLDLTQGAANAEEAVPNYFVASIVPTTADSIRTLQASRDHDDTLAGGFKTWAVDRGDRYLELVNLVGNGSMQMNIGEEDYSPILDTIGQAIISKKSTFTLDRAPTTSEEMIVTLTHADGTSETIPYDKFTIVEKSIVITDQALVLSFKATDQISINYQPKTLY